MLLCLAASFQSSAQVANDDCSGAIPLVLDTGYTMNTKAATSANDPTNVCGGPFGRSVWFRVTPPRNGMLTLSTCGSDFDTAFQVYTGTCTNRVPVLCSDDLGPACPTHQASANFLVYSNVTYLVAVGGYTGAWGNLRIVASMPPPPNDQCSGAIALSSGVRVTISTANATTNNDPQPNCYGLTGFGSGVWFSFTPVTNDLITIDTATDFSTVTAIYTGTCGNLTPVTSSQRQLCRGHCHDRRCDLLGRHHASQFRW
jgi:hypothetical protein